MAEHANSSHPISPHTLKLFLIIMPYRQDFHKTGIVIEEGPVPFGMGSDTANSECSAMTYFNTFEILVNSKSNGKLCNPEEVSSFSF